MCIVQRVVCSVQCVVGIVQSVMDILQYVEFTVQCKLFSKQSAICTGQYTLNLHFCYFVVWKVKCVALSVQCSLCNVLTVCAVVYIGLLDCPIHFQPKANIRGTHMITKESSNMFFSLSTTYGHSRNG